MVENPYLTQVSRVFQNSEIIFEEGSYGEEMYIIHSGVVELVKQAPEGEVIVATLKPGEFFGEMALVDNSPRSVRSVAGADQTRLLALDRVKFMFLVSHQPAFALTVLHVLCQRIRAMNERLSQLEQGSQA